MTDTYIITAEVLVKFKEPFGQLIKGTLTQTAKQLQENVEKEKPPQIITVGDTVTRNLHRHKIPIKLAITDEKNLRKKTKPQTYPEKNLIKIKNPVGTITQEAVTAIKNALKARQPTHMLVEGEEDMLTLIAVMYAAENSFVIYGQPHEGIVMVKATAAKKTEAQQIFKAMKKI